MPSLYPRATLKRIIKTHQSKALSKNVDVLIYLNCMIFLQKLAQEANSEAEASKENMIEKRHIKAALEASHICKIA
ncbi:4808_t:CDS:2 [Funneliformis caledonium]|uniref:4808_t:CDS:1 n=1 Tax=Funneliformis caledonium TaxID=1117310 RepID=A0A9N8W1V2_9GLOM|nr:4808_t:CDS:2 [Funneliformis caledonium]